METFNSYSEGLPDEAGDLVAIRLIVNKYTTKREIVDTAWEFVRVVRERQLAGRNVPRRCRAGQAVEEGQLPRWQEWHRARRVEGETLEQVAGRFDLPVETVRYGIEQMDGLMRPVER